MCIAIKAVSIECEKNQCWNSSHHQRYQKRNDPHLHVLHAG